MLAYHDVGFRYETGDDAEGVPDTRPAAVMDVRLTVPGGAFAVLAGNSGSGKSTLVRMANGLIPHFHPGSFVGNVRVGGRDTRETTVRDLAATAGVVFQNQVAQLFNATVERELAFGPHNAGVPQAEVATRVQWAAERTGITHLLARPTGQLSGGESTRVAIASVLTMHPPLLVLDEPSAALDPVATASLWTLLHDLHREGTTVMVAEHRLEPAWEYEPSVAVMDGGRLVFDGALPVALNAPLCPGVFPRPRLTELFAAAGLPDHPVTVPEAAAIIRARGLTLCPGQDASAIPGELLLRAEGVVSTRDGRTVLQGVGICLHRGEAVALVGANGAGKTTLLRLLAGLTMPTRGRVTDRAGRPLPRGRLGLLLQNANDALFCHTVREEVAYSARLLGRYDADWIESLHERFALTPLLDRPPLGLSDGEKRRVALAAMLGHRPDVVLLDEPTAGQDAPRRAALAETIAILREHGAGVLLATHDLAFAAAHCPRWLVLADGTITADATPDAILADAPLLARAHLLPTPIARLAAALGVPYPGERATLGPAHALSEAAP